LVGGIGAATNRTPPRHAPHGRSSSLSSSYDHQFTIVAVARPLPSQRWQRRK